jgi:class 3 adenylate cyclase
VGASARNETNVFGDAPNLAARVQAAAPPDIVLITNATHRLVSGLFVFERLGVHPLKGMTAPLE